MNIEALMQAAEHLQTIWIEREQDQRKKAHASGEIGTLESEATKECRRDLQYEFRLIRRLGSGPMTKAEMEEYLKQESKS